MGERVSELLIKNRDTKYRDFHANLVPNVDKKRIIGVRVPILRKIAEEMYRDNHGLDKFLSELPHKYYEEDMLHGLIISQIRDFDEVIDRLECFLPYIDNWAVCDSLRPICFKDNKKRLLCKIDGWLLSKDTYTVRFGIEMLMVHYLDDDFDVSLFNRLIQIKTDEYYLKMMLAWYFATALAKQYESTLPLIETKCLEKWVHNKTIQKAVESLRITDKQKKYLKMLKI